VYAVTPQPFPTSIRDAVRRGQLCGALDGLWEAGVDAPFRVARGEAAPDRASTRRIVLGYLAKKAFEHPETIPLGEIQVHFVDETPSPILPGFKRAHDRMLGSMKVLSGVLVLR
jgi:hypothetical protein